MKILALLFCYSLVFGGLGNAQTACSFEVASPFSLPNGSCDDFGSSTGVSSDDPSLTGLKILIQGSEAASDLVRREVTDPVEFEFRPLLTRQSDFSCTANETCYSVRNALFCADERNGDFHDPDGTAGNINTGHFTSIDGQQGNIYCAVQPSSTTATTSTSAVPTGDGASSLQSLSTTFVVVTGMIAVALLWEILPL